jgi:hypothetical protein
MPRQSLSARHQCLVSPCTHCIIIIIITTTTIIIINVDRLPLPFPQQPHRPPHRLPAPCQLLSAPHQYLVSNILHI